MTEELKAIKRLKRENTLVRHHIIRCEKSWNLTIYLLQEAFEVALLVQTVLEEKDDIEALAKKKWLAFWGIHIESVQNFGIRLEG